jgi:ribosomal protein L32
MHTKPMDESEGTSGDWKASDRACPHCGVKGQRYYRAWESSCGGYEDEENECRACGKTWWVEGADA